MICFAHRGAKGYGPENTLAAFARALELGANWVEADVYPVEGELVVFHDLRLERTTNGTGFVFRQTLPYLRSLNAGNGEKIPFLREVIDLLDGQIGLNIELKWPGTAAPVAALIDTCCRELGWHPDRFLVSSFIHSELQLFSQVLPGIRIGALTGDLPLCHAAFAEQLGAWSVHANIEFVSREFVEDAHRRNLKFFVYTVNHPEEFDWMEELGVDGVFTDYPDRLLRRVGEGM